MFDPKDLATLEDPYPTYAAQRAAGAVVELEGRYVGAFGHETVNAILRDQRFTSSPIALAYASALPEGALRDEMTNRINFLDPPDHPRVRGLVSKAFTPRRIEELRPWVADTADALLDQLDALSDGVELMAGFAHQLPSLVISELLGVPIADRDRLTELSDLVTPVFGTSIDPGDKQRAVAAAEEMHDYFSALIDERRRRPVDDLLTALVLVDDDGSGLARPELLSLVATLYSAGHRTTRDLFGNGLELVLGRGVDLWQLDIGAITDELLRLAQPTHYVARVPQEPIEVGGVVVDAWQPILLFLAAANRDPAAYADPDEFRLGRDGPPALSFAFGAHYCLGAALARLEVTEMLRAVTRRWRSLTLADRPRRWHQRGPFRGLDELVVVTA